MDELTSKKIEVLEKKIARLGEVVEWLIVWCACLDRENRKLLKTLAKLKDER